MFLNLDVLEKSQLKQTQYNTNQPIPHIVLENLFNSQILKKAREYFPATNEDFPWWVYNNRLEIKLATNKLELLDPIFTEIFNSLNSSKFIRFLENLTGIKGLITDPHLNGGGLHCIEPGGKLDIHLDSNFHPETKLDRRVNVVIYLNENWKDSWNGQLEFWNPEMNSCIQKISPVFNNTLIFNVTDKTYHGHPDPLLCPSEISRKSLAVFYYTNGRPPEEVSPSHSVLYQARPQDLMDEEIVALRLKRAKGRLS